MTRNEWIAETARDLAATNRTEYARSGEQNAMLIWAEIAWTDASTLADAAERRGQAPWQSAPPLTDAAAKVVEAAVAWEDGVSKAIALHPVMLNIDDQKLIAAVRAYRESVK